MVRHSWPWKRGKRASDEKPINQKTNYHAKRVLDEETKIWKRHRDKRTSEHVSFGKQNKETLNTDSSSARKSNHITNDLHKHKEKPVPKGLIILLVFLLIILTFLIGIFAANSFFEKNTGVTIAECWSDAAETINNSSPEDFTPNGISKIYDSDGDLMVNLSRDKSSTYLDYEEIPEDVINAFISVEDHTFWTNPGYDLKAIARAGISILRSHTISQGGSTITQQLCKLTYLSNEKTMERKVREIFLACQLTKKYSKQQIMEWYVNNCCFANGIYGIRDAAKAYFNKEVSDLTLGEIAYLCAIPNRPEYYDPWDDPDNALDRSEKILGDMLEQGYISESEYSDAMSETLNVTSGAEETRYDYAASYAIKCAVEILMERAGFEFETDFNSDEEYENYQTTYSEAYSEAKNELYSGGYTVYTSIDDEAQEKLQEIIDNELDFDSEKSNDGVYNLQSAATVIDNETHKVIAIVGGRSEKDTNAAYGYNRAYQYKRQPGSAIKPLIAYIPALEQEYTADTKLKDIDVQSAYSAYKAGKDLSTLSGTSYSLRYSVEHSLNGTALLVYSKITPETGIQFLLDMGFANIVPDDYYLSAVLGGFTYGTNTLEMATAYSTIANYGSYNQSTCVTSMVDENGNELFQSVDEKGVYDSDACIEITDIMTGVLETGTASSLNWSDETEEPAAGKTGTTNDEVDGWFCGYTDDYTISVWVGRDDNTPTENLKGGTYPAQIWKETMLWLIGNRAKEREDSIFTAKTTEESHDGEIWHLNQDAFIRDAPSTNSNILFTLTANTDVIVIDMDTYWTEISVDGTTCYIYTPFLSIGSVETH